jgi:hypothetical protein
MHSVRYSIFDLFGYLKHGGELDTLRKLIHAHTTEADCKLAVAGEMAIPISTLLLSSSQHHNVAYTLHRISTVSPRLKDRSLEVAGVTARRMHGWNNFSSLRSTYSSTPVILNITSIIYDEEYLILSNLISSIAGRINYT